MSLITDPGKQGWPCWLLSSTREESSACSQFLQSQPHVPWAGTEWPLDCLQIGSKPTAIGPPPLVQGQGHKAFLFS